MPALITVPTPNPNMIPYSPAQGISTIGAGGKIVKTAPAGATANLYFDCNAGSFFEAILLGAASTTTIEFVNPQPGQHVFLQVTQSASGSDLVTWVNCYFAGGTEPTLTTTASHYDLLEFVYDDVAGLWISRVFAADYAA